MARLGGQYGPRLAFWVETGLGSLDRGPRGGARRNPVVNLAFEVTHCAALAVGIEREALGEKPLRLKFSDLAVAVACLCLRFGGSENSHCILLSLLKKCQEKAGSFLTTPLPHSMISGKSESQLDRNSARRFQCEKSARPADLLWRVYNTPTFLSEAA